MTVSDRDKRALIILGVAALVALTIYFWPAGEADVDLVATANSAPAAEQRLERVRQLAAQVPARQQQLEVLNAQLVTWESGLVKTETAQQAQAELLQVLRRLGSGQVPAIEFGSTEIGPVRRLGDSEEYGEVLVSVSFECGIEQLVNLLTDLTAQPEGIVTDEIRINPGRPETKQLRVRMTIAGLVPSSLVPQRKGLGSF